MEDTSVLWWIQKDLDISLALSLFPMEEKHWSYAIIFITCRAGSTVGRCLPLLPLSLPLCPSLLLLNILVSGLYCSVSTQHKWVVSGEISGQSSRVKSLFFSPRKVPLFWLEMNTHLWEQTRLWTFLPHYVPEEQWSAPHTHSMTSCLLQVCF